MEELKIASYHCDYEPLVIPSNTTLNQNEISKLRKANDIELLQLIEVSIELPKNVCWWEQPIVCRWQPWDESADYLLLESDLHQFNCNSDKTKSKSENRRSHAVDVIIDFNLHDIPEEMRLHCFIMKHILPRLSATYKFECEIEEDEVIRQNEIKRRKMLLLEFEEEQRMKALEKARLKAKRKQLRWEEKLERLKSQNSSENNSISSTRSTSSSSSDSSSTASVTPQFREFVQGTAAKELFLHLDRICPLKIRKKAIKYVIGATSEDEKYMLSDLLKQIDECNKSEQPYFKEPPKIEIEANSVADKLEKAKRKKKKIVSRMESPKIVLKPHHRGKWTTDGIYVQKYDDELKTIVFRTTDLGEIYTQIYITKRQG